MSSFHVDGRISIKLDVELADRLGQLIMKSGSEDKQLVALGWKLVNMIEEEGPQTKSVRQPSIVSEWEGPVREKVMNHRSRYGKPFSE
jgi:hypothetical protein